MSTHSLPQSPCLQEIRLNPYLNPCILDHSALKGGSDEQGNRGIMQCLQSLKQTC